ncbi:MAG TPA: MFS transporter [Haliangiales bacterium]|nr:MFS transporter [Haliangiales bacterium]
MFRRKRIALLGVLGFSSGLPLMLTGQTLGAWMSTEGVALDTIGAFALVGLPYTFKWLWAPILDRYAWPFLGRRRGWMLVLQLALVAAIAAMGTVSPREAPGALATLAAIVAFLSATQDVVLDAYQTDLLADAERAAGAAAYVMGYRVAVVVAGTGMLILADHVAWRVIYATLAGAMLAGVLATLVAEEPPPARAARPATLAEAAWRPVVELGRLPRAALVLAFVALFKFGDYLAQPLLVPFFQRGVGLSLTEIGLVNQVCGLAGVVAGGVVAAAAVARVGLRAALVGFGALQAATNVLYAVLAITGKSTPMFATAVLADSLANAMGTAAFVAFLMAQCDPRVSATQFALLTSLSSIGQRVFGPLGGPIVASAGWTGFFATTALVAIPGLALVRWLPIGGPPPRGDRP